MHIYCAIIIKYNILCNNTNKKKNLKMQLKAKSLIFQEFMMNLSLGSFDFVFFFKITNF